MTRNIASKELVWRGNSLMFNGKCLAKIVFDEKYPSMWRVAINGRLTDMVNLARAKDAARALAVSLLNTHGTASEASPIAQIEGAAT